MKITGMLKITDAGDDDGLVLEFNDETGTAQRIEMNPKAANVILSAILTSQSRRLASGKTSHQYQPLVAQGASSQSYENGLVGLSFHLEHDGQLHLAFPREAVPMLQAQLARMVGGLPPAVH